MNDDLNKTYDALFFGPLPAVDGHNLTNIDATHLINIVPEENLPDNIAFQDRVNIFDENNDFVFGDDFDDVANAIRVGFGTVDEDLQGNRDDSDVESWLRIGSQAANEFYISQNFSYDGSTYNRDLDTLDGLILEIADGELNFKNWLPSDLFDYPDPYLADTWRFDGKSIWMRTYEQDDTMNVVLIDAHWDIIYLADSAGEFTDDWKGFLAIPNKADTKLPALDAGEPNRLDGILVIDKVNEMLCYYTNGNRFAIAGVPF